MVDGDGHGASLLDGLSVPGRVRAGGTPVPVRAEWRALAIWWGLALAVGAAAPFGPAPRVFAGLSVGLAVGSVYVWLLSRRVRAVVRMTPQRAAVTTQVGAVVRLAFVLIAFAVASRLWPEAELLWAVAAFFVPVAVWMIGLLRREVNG